MPANGETLERDVMKGKSVMTKRIEKVFSRNQHQACKNHIAMHLSVK